VARVELKLPKVGLVMENARLVRWLKAVGDVVRQGEPLLELETEKSVVEIESAESGRLLELVLQPDQEAQVGDRIAWLEVDAPAVGAAPPLAAPPDNAAASRPSPATAPARPAVPGGAGTAGGERLRSSPVARRLAGEHDLDLRQISGTGPRGRVQLADVQRAVASEPAPQGAQPLSSMRRAVARLMTLSNATVPQFFVERTVDWTAVRSVRAQLLAGLGADVPRPTVNDFLLQAIARTLIAVPALNATFFGDARSPNAALVPASGVHIGLVVATGDGLLVPVLHGVEQLGVVALARRRSDVVERALQGTLRRDELEGATFSLSNLGARGPDRFTAIINPPQSAILAVGRERDTVVAIGTNMQIRPSSQLTLTVDHRVADGRLASDFLAALVDVLEGDAWHLG